MRETILSRRRGVRYSLDVLSHLVGREFRLRYRRAVLGWVWAIAEPLARLAILTFIFTQVLPLGIPNYAAYLFSGLIAWMWFAAGVRSVTTSAVDRSDLLLFPRLPRLAAPTVSVLVDGLDYVAALPVLTAFLVIGPGLPLTAILLPVILIIQLLLTLGIGLSLATAHVYFRDTRLFVDVALTLGFYLTPVFYDASSVPDRWSVVIDWNPMAHVLEFHRDLLVDGRLPDLSQLATMSLVSVAVFTFGLFVYRRSSPFFVDEL